MSKRRMKKIYVYFLLIQLILLAGAAFAQQQTIVQGQGMPPGDNVVGKVTAVTKDSVTVAPLLGGEPVNLTVSDATRVIKDRQPAGIGDIKTGDTVFARGPLQGQSMDAAVVAVIDPNMVQQRMQGGGPGGPGPMSQFKPEDMG